nr:uncharacterized protein CI109_004999 [Kwoniella shandongensis]KAA5526609.1 hypothetical protein CI109_004999 [Kwoniella shandongensis]
MTTHTIPTTPSRSTSVPTTPTSHIGSTPPLTPSSSTISTLGDFTPCSHVEDVSSLTPAHTPSAQSQEYDNRRSIISIRRKPVPTHDESDAIPIIPSSVGIAVQSEENDDEDPFRSTTSLPDRSTHPPSYILPVVPISQPETETQPPSYIPSSAGIPSIDPVPTLFDISLGESSSSPTFSEDLPRYAEQTQTEPKTLAKALWKWGFLCPLFWIVGVMIMFIPLKAELPEEDPEKAQKLEEMITVLRKTEMKYAKRSMYSLVGFVALIAIIVIVVIVVMALRH